MLLLGAYLALRVALTVPGTGPSGNYAGGLGLNSLAGLALLCGSSLTVTDTVALALERNYVVVGATVAVSLAFMAVLAVRIRLLPRGGLWRLAECAVIVVALAAPHLIMEHPGEMHAFPVLWGTALAVGLLMKGCGWRRWQKWAVVLFFGCGVCVSVHKGYYMYDAGRTAGLRVRTAVQGSASVPRSVCVLDCDPPRPCYSVFRASGEDCWDKGKATRLYFDLVNPKKVVYRHVGAAQLPRAIAKALSENKYDAVWVVENNVVRVVAQH